MRQEWPAGAGVASSDGGGEEPDGGDGHLDGNLLAGPLRDVFAVDMTGTSTRCGHCTSTGPLAGLRVYANAPGLVARCPTCLSVMLRLVRTPTETWLDLRGATFLRIPAPADVPRM